MGDWDDYVFFLELFSPSLLSLLENMYHCLLFRSVLRTLSVSALACCEICHVANGRAPEK